MEEVIGDSNKGKLETSSYPCQNIFKGSSNPSPQNNPTPPDAQKGTPVPTAQASESSNPDSAPIRVPRFELLPEDRLKKELEAFGFKTTLHRLVGIALLRQVWKYYNWNRLPKYLVRNGLEW